MGVYRMWRDAGYGVGAILIGLAMDLIAVEAAFYLTGIFIVAFDGIVLVWMEGTHPEFVTHEPLTAATQNKSTPATEEA